jgi:aerobic-type carbon monoxide dehydrogenase small subunit (CoxS/CutS family)
VARNALLMKDAKPTGEQIADWLSGNMCCGGAYGAIAQSILETEQGYLAKRKRP